MRIFTALTTAIGCLTVLVAAAPAPAPPPQETAAEFHCIEECLSVEEDCLLNSISMTECVNQYDWCHTACLPNRPPPQQQAPPPPPPAQQAPAPAPPATPVPSQTDKNDKNKNNGVELDLHYEEDIDDDQSPPVLSGDDGDEQDDDGGY